MLRAIKPVGIVLCCMVLLLLAACSQPTGTPTVAPTATPEPTPTDTPTPVPTNLNSQQAAMPVSSNRDALIALYNATDGANSQAG